MKGTTEYDFEPHDVAFEPDSHTVNTDTNRSAHQDTFTHQKEWHALLIIEDQDSTATDSDKLAVSVVKTQGGMTAIFVPNKEVFKELLKSLLVSQTWRIIGTVLVLGPAFQRDSFLLPSRHILVTRTRLFRGGFTQEIG
jgi:hypothetical protein